MIIGAGMLLGNVSIPWVFISSGQATGANPVVPVAVMSAQAGDLILIVAAKLATYATPSGYTAVTGYSAFYKIAAGSDADVTLSGVNATNERAACLLYRLIGNPPIDIVSSASSGSGTIATANSLTTTTNNDLNIAIFSQYLGTTTQTWGSVGGMVSRVSAGFTTSICGLHIADRNISLAGVSGAVTSAINGGGISWGWDAIQIAFKAKHP